MVSQLRFLKIFIYLFIWLPWVLVAAGRLLSCGMQLLVVACMWDLVPWPGIKPGPPALGAWCLIHCLPGKSLSSILTCFFFLNLFILFIYFWLCWVSVAMRRLSLVAASGGYSLLQCVGFSLRWLLLLQSTGSRHVGFSSCGSRALEHRLSSCCTWA